MERKLRIVLVEDNPDDVRLTERALRAGAVKFESQCVDTGAAFARALEEAKPDVVLSDYRLPQFDGLAATRLARRLAPDVPVIIVSGTLTDETAVELLREGAVDYVLKDRLSRLAPAVRRAVDEAAVRADARQAAQALRDSERRFRLLAAVAPVGIFCTDAKGDCTYVNERWCEMAGIDAERALGRGWIAGVHHEDRAGIAETWYRAAQDGADFDAEYRLAGSGRGPVWVVSRAVPQKDDGHAGGHVCVLTDITEGKRTEQALREQLDELRRFQEATVDRELHMEEMQALIEQLEGEVARLRRAGGGPA